MTHMCFKQKIQKWEAYKNQWNNQKIKIEYATISWQRINWQHWRPWWSNTSFILVSMVSMCKDCYCIAMEMHWVHIKEASCLMLKGLISLAPPVKNRSARKALARSVGWKGSQNKWSDRFLHRLDAGVHANKPLKGPSPQHPMFVVLKPAHEHKPKIIWQSVSDRLIIIHALENVEWKSTNQLDKPNIIDL